MKHKKKNNLILNQRLIFKLNIWISLIDTRFIFQYSFLFNIFSIFIRILRYRLWWFWYFNILIIFSVSVHRFEFGLRFDTNAKTAIKISRIKKYVLTINQSLKKSTHSFCHGPVYNINLLLNRSVWNILTQTDSKERYERTEFQSLIWFYRVIRNLFVTFYRWFMNFYCEGIANCFFYFSKIYLLTPGKSSMSIWIHYLYIRKYMYTQVYLCTFVSDFLPILDYFPFDLKFHDDLNILLNSRHPRTRSQKP